MIAKKNPPEFFMNHIHILEGFCLYFRTAGQNLIEHLENNKEKFIDIDDPIIFNDLIFKNNSSYKEFLSDIKLSKFSLKGNIGNSLLSQREFECLLWFTKNKTAKEIGRVLSLSPRTVEDYLVNIKNKLGCQTRYELIELAYKNPIIKSFIE